MQTWRGCLPIIGYFTELQEQHAMTQTSEPAIKPEHNEGGKRFADPLVRGMTGACKDCLGSTRWRYDFRRQNGRPIGRLEGEPRQSA